MMKLDPDTTSTVFLKVAMFSYTSTNEPMYHILYILYHIHSGSIRSNNNMSDFNNLATFYRLTHQVVFTVLGELSFNISQ